MLEGGKGGLIWMRRLFLVVMWRFGMGNSIYCVVSNLGKNQIEAPAINLLECVGVYRGVHVINYDSLGVGWSAPCRWS